MSDAYYLFLESILHKDVITKSESIFAQRRALTVKNLEKYKPLILKLRNNDLRNHLLEIYYSYSSYSSLSLSRSSLLCRSFSSYDGFNSL